MSIEGIYQGLEILMLGTSLEPSVHWRFQTNREVLNKLRICKRLEDICERYGLDKRLAHETMRRLIKKNRHFYSYKKQMKEFLDVLNSDYRYMYKARAIKKEYEIISGV